MLFSSTDMGTGWDGKYKGVLVDTGIYTYIISGKDIKGEVNLKGTVMVIR
jgi:hypothetical protein